MSARWVGGVRQDVPVVVPSTEALRLYRVVLEEIKGRIELATRALESATDRHSVEAGALHLRFALEGILLSSLVTHQHMLEPINKALRKADAGEARKRVEAVNSDWWPKAIQERPGGPSIRADLVDVPPSEYISRDEWGRAYGTTSDLLHARNPFRGPREGPHIAHRELTKTVGALKRMLNCHMIHPAGADYFILAHMAEGSDSRVGTYLFGRVENLPEA